VSFECVVQIKIHSHILGTYVREAWRSSPSYILRLITELNCLREKNLWT
jgi:hypothetical protein